MSVESDQGKAPRSPSFQLLLGAAIAGLGGLGKLVAVSMMDESSRLPVSIGELDLVVNQFQLHWFSNAVIVLGALFAFTAPRRN
jgi:hypothetical protein